MAYSGSGRSAPPYSSGLSAYLAHGKSDLHPLDSGRNDQAIVADIAAPRAEVSIYRVGVMAEAIGFIAADAAGIFVLPKLLFITRDDFGVIKFFA